MSDKDTQAGKQDEPHFIRDEYGRRLDLDLGHDVVNGQLLVDPRLPTPPYLWPRGRGFCQ